MASGCTTSPLPSSRSAFPCAPSSPPAVASRSLVREIGGSTDMPSGRIRAEYWVETPLPLEQAVDVLAGEQSSGTFVKVAGETDALTAAHRASVDCIQELSTASVPSLPGGRAAAAGGVYRQAIVE